jgi:hypothetical protein
MRSRNSIMAQARHLRERTDGGSDAADRERV